MSKISDIVEINISRETTPVSRASFNIPLFIAACTSFSTRTKEYTDIEEVQADFRSTSNVYKACSKFFSQTLKPPKVIIGRRQVNTVTGSIATTAAAATYTMTVNGTAFSATADSSPTVIEICAALRSAFVSAGIIGVSMTDNLDGTFTIGPTTPGSAWSVTADTKISLVNSASTESLADALSAIEEENGEWYAVTCESHSDSDIAVLAEAVEARKKIYGTSSSSTAIKGSGTTDIASQLKDDGYQRTFIMYSAQADSDFPECAWIGGQLPEVPGSNTWKFRTLAGVTVDKLNSTESGNCFNKNCNTYEYIGGVRMAREGRMAGGEWIDVMIFCDWLEARMAERIFFRLVNSKKIPFTQAGLTIIQGEMYAVLQEGVTNGGLTSNPKPVVRVPNVADISPNEKALRTVENITFEGVLAGALHFVKIRGTVSY